MRSGAAARETRRRNAAACALLIDAARVAAGAARDRCEAPGHRMGQSTRARLRLLADLEHRRFPFTNTALSSQEGVALMCLAEALLGASSTTDTAGRADSPKRSAAGDWERHRGHSPSMFVNAATWALMLTGRSRHAAGRRRALGPARSGTCWRAPANRSCARRPSGTPCACSAISLS